MTVAASVDLPPRGLSPVPAVHVAINLLYLLPGVVGGTETYAVSLVEALAARDDPHTYTVFVNREASSLPLPEGPRVRRIVCDLRATSRARRYAYEQFRLPSRVAAVRADVLHSLGYVGPVWARVPHVLTVPDLNFRALADAMPRAKRALLRTFVEAAARRAHEVLTISHFSREQIIGHLRLPPSRVHVTHLAGRRLPRRPPSRVDGRTLAAERYGVPGPYLLAFGSLSPHKNIPRLIEAFARVRDEIPHTLVLAGHLPPGGAVERAALALDVAPRIRVTGYVPDAYVLPLLAGADAFVMPSLYEGFGLPVLDAQACGTPVACARAGSLPEVAGDAALLFDPTSVADIAAAVRTLAVDAGTRERLVRAARANLERFTWAATARGSVEAYLRAAARRAA